MERTTQVREREREREQKSAEELEVESLRRSCGGVVREAEECFRSRRRRRLHRRKREIGRAHV